MSRVETDSSIDRGTSDMLVSLFRRYPARSAVVLLALLMASLLDGLGLSTLLSMISLSSQLGGDTDAVLSDTEDPSLPEQLINGAFGAVGIEPTLPWLLALGIFLVLGKTLVVLLANRQVGYAVAQVATDLRLDLVGATPLEGALVGALEVFLCIQGGALVWAWGWT